MWLLQRLDVVADAAAAGRGCHAALPLPVRVARARRPHRPAPVSALSAREVSVPVDRCSRLRFR